MLLSELHQFKLLESYKRDISLEKAAELIEVNCKDALKHINTPLMRGTKLKEDAYILEGEAGTRESRNTSNHYTIILDEILPPLGYPKRSKSIILGNYENKDYVQEYGNIFAILPYDNIKIGVCYLHDIFGTKTFIGSREQNISLEKMNEIFEKMNVPDYTYQDLVQYIEEVLDDTEDEHYDEAVKIFSKGEVDDIIRKAYSVKQLRMTLETTKTVYDVLGPRELWIGGKCIAIKIEDDEILKDKLRPYLNIPEKDKDKWWKNAKS